MEGIEHCGTHAVEEDTTAMVSVACRLKAVLTLGTWVARKAHE